MAKKRKLSKGLRRYNAVRSAVSSYKRSFESTFEGQSPFQTGTGTGSYQAAVSEIYKQVQRGKGIPQKNIAAFVTKNVPRYAPRLKELEEGKFDFDEKNQVEVESDSGGLVVFFDIPNFVDAEIPKDDDVIVMDLRQLDTTPMNVPSIDRFTKSDWLFIQETNYMAAFRAAAQGKLGDKQYFEFRVFYNRKSNEFWFVAQPVTGGEFHDRLDAAIREEDERQFPEPIKGEPVMPKPSKKKKPVKDRPSKKELEIQEKELKIESVKQFERSKAQLLEEFKSGLITKAEYRKKVSKLEKFLGL